ncbi:MAG TPA: hypothetical protein GX743_03580 [Actinomycetales bacterium]|nr:hypothetical protein [Actinomycetales bacterium]
MRIYLPATLEDLSADTLVAARVHAVTAQLRRELPDDDEEMLELVAFLAAADDSVRLIAERGASPRRLVISADVLDGSVGPAPSEDIETALIPGGPVPWELVVAVHVDDAEASEEVSAAAAGDEGAFDALGERELLWYDASELEELRAELGTR